MKKYILILLLFTGFLNAQTYQNPTFGTVITKTTPIVTSTNYLTTVEASGLQSKISPLNLPVPTSVINAIKQKADLSTGLLKNGLISINADPTKFNISAGIGIISNFDDPDNPVSTIISFPAFTGVTPTYLLTGNITYIAINSTPAVVMQATPFTDAQRRDLIILGAAIHSNLTNINVVNNISAPSNAIGNQLHDFMEAVGALNITGNKYSANGANLSLNKSAGTIFKFGVNFATNWKDPHVLSQSAGTALTFRYRTQNGTEGSDVTVINPAVYDLNNVLTSVPNNKFSIQTVTMFQTGLTRIQYGQNVYDDLASAQAAIFTRDYNVEANIKENGITRAYIIVKNNATSLQNATDSRIIEAQKFGGIASGGVAFTFANIVAALGYTPANDTNVLHTTGALAESVTGAKTTDNIAYPRTNYFNFINDYNSVSNNRTVDNTPFSIVNNFGGIGGHFNNVTTGWGLYGFNQGAGKLVGLDSKTGSTGNLLEFSKNEVTKGYIDHNSYAYFPYAEFSSPNVANPQVRVTNGSLPSVIEFPKTGFTMRGTVGALGSYEMNMSTNMDYTSSPGVHRLYDNTKNATWLAIGDFGWQMQFAAADVSAGDVWNNQGQPRLLYQYQDGRMRINTTAPLSTPGTTLGDAMFGVRRAAGKASISGETDLVIEGNKTYGTAGEVYINPSVQTGGSGVGIGTTSLFTAANFNFLTINGLNGSGVAFSSNNVLSSRFGVNTAETYLIETRALPMAFYTNGTKKMQIHSSGGVSIGNTTDLGANNLNVTGNVTAATPTVSTHLATKGYVDGLVRPYKSYTGIFNQSGTSAPTVATIFENTIGAIVWTRTSAGVYVGTLSGAFTSAKTIGFLTNTNVTGSSPINVKISSSSVNTIDVTAYINGIAADNACGNMSLEIRVYN